MICAECKGRGYVKLFRHGRMNCVECGGTGRIEPYDPGQLAREQQAARAVAAHMSYVDGRFPERDCDRCGKPYRGPAVYCSLACAIDDA